MAIKIATGDPTFPFLYNVEMWVGPDQNAPNQRDDVMLVQYCLKHIYTMRWRQDPPFPWPPHPGDIEVDGYWGPTTRRWINQFQRDVLARGRKTATDGRVDAVPLKKGGIQKEGSISHTYYTIIFMNTGLKKARPTLFADISNDPDCPPELRSRVEQIGGEALD
jgi:hypothetical protein